MLEILQWLADEEVVNASQREKRLLLTIKKQVSQGSEGRVVTLRDPEAEKQSVGRLSSQLRAVSKRRAVDILEIAMIIRVEWEDGIAKRHVNVQRRWAPIDDIGGSWRLIR